MSPIFIYDTLYTSKYELIDILQINASVMCVTLALVCFSYAMKWGKGGSVQAIENMKTLV